MANGSFKEKERVNLGALRVVRHSTYEAKTWDKEHVGTVHRYVFGSPTGDTFVYSGVWLNVAVGDYVSIRATVKRVEERYNCVRLARVKLTRRGIEETMI
jgi:hypothetical protein